jgi:hypothetical protein
MLCNVCTELSDTYQEHEACQLSPCHKVTMARGLDDLGHVWRNSLELF